MTALESQRLTELVAIAREVPCPLSVFERDFVFSLASLPQRVALSERQGAVFDRLVQQHLVGEEDDGGGA